MDRWVILHHVLDKRATACGADRPECSTTIDTMRWLFSLLPWLGSTFPHRGRGPWQCKWIQSCSGWPPLFYHHLLSWWEWFLPGWQEGSVVWSVRKWCEWYATASCSLGLNPDEHLGEALDVGALSTTIISTGWGLSPGRALKLIWRPSTQMMLASLSACTDVTWYTTHPFTVTCLWSWHALPWCNSLLYSTDITSEMSLNYSALLSRVTSPTPAEPTSCSCSSSCLSASCSASRSAYCCFRLWFSSRTTSPHSAARIFSRLASASSRLRRSTSARHCSAVSPHPAPPAAIAPPSLPLPSPPCVGWAESPAGGRNSWGRQQTPTASPAPRNHSAASDLIYQYK